MKLTKAAIDKLTYEKSGGTKDIRWDEGLPGFGVRVYPAGKKSFVVFYRIGRRQHLMTLGRCDVLTLEQARKLAKTILADAIRGEDALEERHERASEIRLDEFAPDYLERHAKVHKKTWLEDARRLRKYILPAFGTKPLSQISRAHVARLHHEITVAGRRTEANRVIAVLSVIFSCAKDWGYAEGENPCCGLKQNRERKRDRWLKPDELPRLAEAIEEEEDPYARAAIWLYLLTGVRRSELLRAKWSDIDWQRAELRLGETKSGNTHYVPLSAQALEILSELERVEGNPHILPGAKEGGHLYDLKKPWQRIRVRADLTDLWLHDLRRTVGSWLAQSGNSLHLIGKILNHQDPATTAVYARFAEDNARVALQEHGRQIFLAAGKPVGKKVFSFRRKMEQRQVGVLG